MAAEYSCLIVEDSPMMRQLLVFALARVKNLRVTEADDEGDGLRKLASMKYDVIITDINMPIMDGLKLVRRVRTAGSRLDDARCLGSFWLTSLHMSARLMAQDLVQLFPQDVKVLSS